MASRLPRRPRRPARAQATYHGFDGRDHTGMLIVHRDVATPMLAVLRRLYADGLPDPPHASRRRLRRQRLPLDRGRQHVGLQLPLRRRHDAVVRARVRPRDRRQPDREPVRDGLGHDVAPREPTVRAANAVPARDGAEGHALVRAFDAVGWGWGGRWSGAKDYQHFSASGRLDRYGADVVKLDQQRPPSRTRSSWALGSIVTLDQPPARPVKLTPVTSRLSATAGARSGTRAGATVRTPPRCWGSSASERTSSRRCVRRASSERPAADLAVRSSRPAGPGRDRTRFGGACRDRRPRGRGRPGGQGGGTRQPCGSPRPAAGEDGRRPRQRPRLGARRARPRGCAASPASTRSSFRRWSGRRMSPGPCRSSRASCRSTA